MTRKSPKVSHEEPKFMSRAIKLARRGRGRTSPNPMVGAVVVKNGRIVGEDFDCGPCEPHAEVEAIRAAGIETQGAELFVTLEPCNHYNNGHGWWYGWWWTDSGQGTYVAEPCTMLLLGSDR